VATAATAPHLIMTYCALLALAVLRDDYALLDRAALKRMVGSCQDADGGCVLLTLSLSFYGNEALIDDDVFGRAGAQIRDDARSRRRRFAHDLLRFCRMRVARRLVLHRPPPRTILYPTLSCAYSPFLHSFPPPHICMKSPLADVRRRIRTNATGRVARRTDVLRHRSAAPRPS
jgi:hypothetical protein